ncbi:beta strand repeat-containing protein, partial [Moheibacter sediminis]
MRKTNYFKSSLMVLLFCFGLTSLWGQISISNNNPVMENFNSMGTSGTASLPSNWKMSAAGQGTSANWSTATNVTAVTQGASSGSPATGARYNFGNGADTSDRAIGFMTSSGYATPNAIFAYYKNTSGINISDLSISFDFERYRINSNTVAVTFYTSTNGTDWTERSSGNIDTTVFPAGSNSYTWTGGTVTSRSVTLTNVNIANDGEFYLKWLVTHSSNTNSPAIALDNVSLTATLQNPTSPNLTISGTLSENTTLNNGVVSLALANETFADNVFDLSNFSLNNAPVGVSIGTVDYINETSATVTLVYDGTDFDANVTNFSITVASGELTTSTNALNSNNITITAVNEALVLGNMSAGFGNQCLNQLSAYQTFTISSSTVLKSGNISLAALNGFTYSETADNENYTSTLTFAHAGGILTNKTIYVKFLPTTAVSYNGNIAVSGAGAPSVNRSVTGSGTNGTIAVTTVTASSIGSESAVSGGSALSNSCGTISAKGVVWAATVNPTIESHLGITNDGTGTDTYTSSITDLSPNTTYNYRAYVTSSSGTTVYGTNYTFTTSQVAANFPFNEDFEGTNNWVVANGTQTNKWFVGSAVSNNSTKSLYISNNASGTTHNYATGNASTVHAYRDILIPTGTANITLSFDWISNGEMLSGNNYDYFRVWLVPTSYIPSASSTITNGSGRIQVGGYFNQNSTFTTYTNSSVNVSSFAGQTMRLVFEWVNDSSDGNQPPAAIDNIHLKLPDPCIAPANQATNLTFGTISSTSIAGSFTSTTADGYLVVISPSSNLGANPTNETTYTAGQVIGNGTVIQSSNLTTFTALSLTPTTTYYIHVFAYNSECLGGPLYNITTPLTGSASTIDGPCISESFTNIPGSGSGYETRTWTGDNGGTWTATDARVDQTITGKAITIRNGILTSPTSNNGIGSLTVTTRYSAATGDGTGTINVYVNNVLKGTLNVSTSLQTQTINDINISGDVVIELRNTSTTKRPSIDDLSWTCYEEPPITWTGTAWSNGTGPSTTDPIFVDGDLIIGNSAEADMATLETGELTITQNGSILIESGHFVTVNGKITNEAGAENFIVASGANLIQDETYTANDNVGDITVQRESQDIVRLDYTLWSSPVTGQQLQDFSPQTLPNRIYTYETTGATEATNGGYVVVPSVTDDFENGKGYLFRAPNTWGTTPAPYAGEFVGVPFNGNVTLPVYPTKYTSVGNPYPSNIDSELFMSANGSVSTLYFWN